MPCAMDPKHAGGCEKTALARSVRAAPARQSFADFRYAFKFCSPTRCAIQSGESCTPTYVPQKTANCGNTDRRCELHSARTSLSGEQITIIRREWLRQVARCFRNKMQHIPRYETAQSVAQPFVSFRTRIATRNTINHAGSHLRESHAASLSRGVNLGRNPIHVNVQNWGPLQSPADRSRFSKLRAERGAWHVAKEKNGNVEAATGAAPQLGNAISTVPE